MKAIKVGVSNGQHFSAFQSGEIERVCDEIEFTERILATSVRLLSNLSGDSLVCWKPSSLIAVGISVCELVGAGLTTWKALIIDPTRHPEFEALECDEEYDGRHYLTLSQPPLTVATIDDQGSPQELVGLFMGSVMWVHPTHRRRGAGRAEIVAAADAKDGLPLAGHRHSNYSIGGSAAVSSAFRKIRSRAPITRYRKKLASNRFELHVITKKLVRPMLLDQDTPLGQ